MSGFGYWSGSDRISWTLSLLASRLTSPAQNGKRALKALPSVVGTGSNEAADQVPYGSPIRGQRQSIACEIEEWFEPKGKPPGEPRQRVGFAKPARAIGKQGGRKSKDGVL